MKELKNISINIFDGKIEEILPFVDLLYVELFGEKFKLDEPFKTELIKNSPQANHTILIAKISNQIIGFLTFSYSFSLFANGRYVIINEMWTKDEFRSNNCGTLLINFLKNILIKEKIKRIDVTFPGSEISSKTFNFYKRNGFIQSGENQRIVACQVVLSAASFISLLTL